MSKVITTVLSLPRTDWKTKYGSPAKKLDPENHSLGRQAIWSKKALDADTRPVASPRGFKAGRKFLALMFCTFNVTLLVMYLVGVNSGTASGYEIKNLQSQITQEKEKETKLRAKISEANSILSLQSEFANLRFVPVSKPTFFENKQVSSR